MKKLLIGFILLAFTPFAIADDGGWYLGFGAGIANSDNADFSEILSSDDNELGFRLFAGNDDIGHLLFVDIGAEVGYANLGDLPVGETDVVDASATLGIDLPFGLGLSAKAGYAYYESGPNDGTEFMYGGGLTGDIGDFSWRADYTVYDLGSTDVDVAMLNLMHRF